MDRISGWRRQFILQVIPRAFVIRSDVGREMPRPFGTVLATLSCKLGQRVPKNLFREVAQPLHGPPLSSLVLKLQESHRRVSRKNPHAQKDGKQVRHGLMIWGLWIHESCPQQDNVTELVG